VRKKPPGYDGASWPTVAVRDAVRRQRIRILGGLLTEWCPASAVYAIIADGMQMAKRPWAWLEVPGAGRWRGRSALWLGAFTLLAFLLRVWRLDFQPLWWDEGWTVYFATSGIAEMIARTAIDIHPPFYYLLLHFWALLAGPSPAAVRLFSAVVGTLSVPLLFLVGRRLLGVKTGLLAALILAVAPFHVYYSQEARMYALVTLLVLASTYCCLSILQRGEGSHGGWRIWVLYVVFTSLAMYTQYYAAFVPLAQTLFVLLLFRRYRPILGRWIAAQAALAVAYLPWLAYAGPKLVAYVGDKLVKEGDVPVGLFTYLQRHLVAFSVGHLGPARSSLVWLALLFVALAFLGLAVGLLASRGEKPSGWRERHAVVFTLLYLAVPVFLGYAVNLRYPFTSPAIERLFLLSAPAFYLLIALGLSWIGDRFRVVWAAPLLVAALSVPPLVDFYGTERYGEEDYRPVVAKVEALALPEDVVVAVHPWQIGYFRAYYEGETPTLYLTPKEATDVTSELWAEDGARMAGDLDELLAEHRYLWFPAHQALGRILESEVEKYLSQQYYPVLSEWFSESTRLVCYAASGQAHLTEETTNFGDRVSLLGYGVAPQSVEAAWGTLFVDLSWRVDQQLDSGYRIALRLVDEKGQVWAAEDVEPLSGLRPFHEEPPGSELLDRHGLLVPAGTPPGRYELQLGLYRLEDGRWLDVLDEQGGPQGVEKLLGEVEVRAPAHPPREEALFVQCPQSSDFAGGLRSLGYSLGGESFRPGDALGITLFWEALADLSEDYTSLLSIEDAEGRAWASVEGSVGTPGYRTSQWTRGQLVRSQQSLMIPAGVPAGRYRLILAVHTTADGHAVPLRRWGLERGESVVLGTVDVEGRAHETEAPASIAHPMSLRLGEAIRFLGYDLDQQDVSAGGSLRLTLYWQALAEMDTSYTVFNHLIDDENRIWGQRDGVPGAGALPTSSWIAGEYVIDAYEVSVQRDAPPGRYVLETGMYDLATMRRLPVLDEGGVVLGDRILLEATPIEVR
jgi:4-amino-4-deoxy-L-arabinose transferase-like glycosyltransferase